jgi:hypothetical protein
MNTANRCTTGSKPSGGERRGLATLVAAFAAFAASCGGGSDPDPADRAEAGDVPDATDLVEDPAEAVDDLVESVEQAQASQGGGSARLVVGDREWTFDSVVCAFGEEQTGQEGAEFVLSSIADGLQMYASIDSFGHSVSLDDIEDFNDPAVDLSTFGDDFIQLDGKHVTASAEFFDGTSDDPTPIEGSFEATCP